MFTKLTTLLCLIFAGGAWLTATAAENQQNILYPFSYSPELEEVIATIRHLPEARYLLEKIRREGRLGIYTNGDNHISRQFGACWDPVNRRMFVDQANRSSRGTLIGSIVFELHNALLSSVFNYYDALAARGDIEEDDYVRSIEYLEYQNSLNASKLVRKGVEQSLFPSDAHLPIYASFEEYYYFQQLGGHSARIAENYRQLAPTHR